MFNKKHTITILFTIISSLFAAVSMVAAADNWYLSYIQAPSSFNCSPNRVVSNDGAISYNLPSDAKITINESINGSQYASITGSIGGKGQQSFPVFSSLFPTQQSYPYVYTVKYNVKVDGETVSSSTLSVKCLDANNAVILVNSLDFAEGVEGAFASAPPDDRLNWGCGDSNVAVLYIESAGIGIYQYETESYISNFVTEADIAEYQDNPPSENTLIASAGSVSVYVLTTGEIQFNMTDKEGKNYALIMSDLTGSDAYGYEF